MGPGSRAASRGTALATSSIPSAPLMSCCPLWVPHQRHRQCACVRLADSAAHSYISGLGFGARRLPYLSPQGFNGDLRSVQLGYVSLSAARRRLLPHSAAPICTRVGDADHVRIPRRASRSQQEASSLASSTPILHGIGTSTRGVYAPLDTPAPYQQPSRSATHNNLPLRNQERTLCCEVLRPRKT